jgi:exodeoxyribonuclease V gamma subunit
MIVLGFQLYTANYLEVLAKLYAKISFGKISDPFEARSVVVQTQGMASYLKQFLASECGIAFNVQMPFPKNFCEEIILRNFPDFKVSQRRFSPETMRYAIYNVFEKNADKFPEVNRYFAGKKRESRMWQLAAQTANLFDNYQIYRYRQEDFVLRGDHWQSRLWRYLEARGGGCRGKNYYFNKFLNAAELKNLPPL